MIGTLERKNARYPVLLECGHETLVSSAGYFSGSALCLPCSTTHPRVRFIKRAYVLRNVHCVKVRWTAR